MAIQIDRLSRRGFTLTELLIAIGVIGVMISLLLPAVQGARVSARKADCSNRVRQIGLAHHEYHEAFRVLPPGTEGFYQRRPLQAWNAKLLPFLDGNEIWQRIEYAYSKSPDPFHSPFHSYFSVALNAFACPEDARVEKPQYVSKVGKFVGLSSFLGVSGTNYLSRDGAFFVDSKIRLGDLHDGLSTTMIVGERPPSTDMNFGWWYAGFGGNGTGAFDATLGMSDNVQGIAELESQCQAGPDRFRIGRLREQCDCRHYWSLHPGGAHFLFADSSVQFLSYSTSQVALNAFATIADGEVFAGE